MSVAETLTFDHGLMAQICHDDCADAPFDGDDAVRIVVLHRRYIDPSNGACGRTPDEVAAWQRENDAEWFAMPLFLYDHSGTIYRVRDTNPFHCPWDSGRVGIIALSRADWPGANDAKLASHAQEIAAIYTNWANGECYGYRLYDGDGELLETCWGYIGLDAVRVEAAAAAESFMPSEAEEVSIDVTPAPEFRMFEAQHIYSTAWTFRENAADITGFSFAVRSLADDDRTSTVRFASSSSQHGM
jgi:hypothetical protein